MEQQQTTDRILQLLNQSQNILKGLLRQQTTPLTTLQREHNQAATLFVKGYKKALNDILYNKNSNIFDYNDLVI